jgi:hypothetical protein
LPLSAVPSSGSMSIQAVTDPSGATVIEKDLSAPAARRSFSVQLAFGPTDLEEGAPDHAAHARPEVFVLGGLGLNSDPAACAGAALEGP